MEFGKLPSVDHINWKIPSDDALTSSFLKVIQEKNPDTTTQFLLGAPAWAHKEWIGKIYPPKTKAADFLYHYSRNFQCIEMNTTHYRIPTEQQVTGWIQQVPAGFIFCPKLAQSISHSLSGMADLSLLQEWWKALAAFKEFLGPCFMQLPPHFDYSHKVSLFRFLQRWPQEFPLCLEFRHPSWFSSEGGSILPALTQFLQSKGIGLVITDVAGRRDVLHTSISADYAFLRFIGNNLHPSDFTRAQDWVQRLHQWQQQGLKKIFFMVHEPDDIKVPEMTHFLIQRLNEICHADLPNLQMGWA